MQKNQKHSPVVNAIAHQAVFQNAKFNFGNHTQGFPLRPGRFFVKVFCIIYLFFLINIAYSTRESCQQVTCCNLKTKVIVYPSVYNLKSPYKIGLLNAFLIDHASYMYFSTDPQR